MNCKDATTIAGAAAVCAGSLEEEARQYAKSVKFRKSALDASEMKAASATAVVKADMMKYTKAIQAYAKASGRADEAAECIRDIHRISR